MNAEPILKKVARALREVKLEAIMIGNAAAALHGAPVTTLDIDFLFRNTPQNLKKLKLLASRLRMIIFRPYYPASALYRLISEAEGLQLDFMPRVHGLKSFAGVRSRGAWMAINSSEKIFIASLEDIIKSKQAANRLPDRAVLPLLKETLREKEEKGKKTKK